ncbi:13958_t:CDS:2 [Acaulospora morrowiae]|uniref:Vacuolar membrane-associated protein IML1 n=1 Tax=Acaulospora morrowiae TaxID=94023 RepID=A0A9N9F329_9GLOM|nr:13958_t:CDS:2 [Acaulospora morrowiae]
MEEKKFENPSSPSEPKNLTNFGSISTIDTNVSSDLIIAEKVAAPLKMNLRILALDPDGPDFTIAMDGLKPGQCLEIYHLNEESDIGKHLFVKVDKENIRLNPGAQLQISVTSNIANSFGFVTNSTVMVREVDAETVAVNYPADHVELYFRDQYIGRSDMWRLSRSLNNTIVYQERRITLAKTIRANVKKIYVKGKQVKCGYITENTKTIFRSESAKLFIFVQMSKEMWEFDEDGDLYYEKTVDGFFKELFCHWKERGTNHVISIVLFSRLFYDYEKDLKDDPDLLNDPTLMKNHEGKWCRDFYKVIVDWETRNDWTTALKELKNELLSYQPKILLREKRKGDSVYNVLSGTNSYAFSGNILEAINLAMNPFDKHYVDRDLLRTGLSIIVVTPGCGRFEVDKKVLRVTTERMTDNGIGLDLVCLSKVPLHIVPLFKFKSIELSKAPVPDLIQKTIGHKLQTKDLLKMDILDPLDYDEKENDTTYSYYKSPDWVDCTFYSYNRNKPSVPSKFITRCKMYEIQMMGIMEHEIESIRIPYLYSSPYSQAGDNFDYDGYDENIFSRNIVPKSKKKRIGLGGINFTSNDYNPHLKIHDDITSSQLKTHCVELSKSYPKALPMSQTQYRRPNYTESMDLGDISKPHAAHDICQDGSNLEGNCQSADDEPYVSNSSTKPIDIISPRNINRDPAPSPAKSYDSHMSIMKQASEKSIFYRHEYQSHLFNPCNPLRNFGDNNISAHSRKWKHAYPKRVPLDRMKWPSMCTPACLPLTTDYFPPINETGLYQEHTYIMNPDQNKIEENLNELIYQRLSQGYQLIIRSADEEKHSQLGNLHPYYLSMGRQVHMLVYDPYNRQVEVKRYVRNIEYGTTPISYSCVVWPRCQDFYENRKVTFNFPDQSYKWNYVDQLACGLQDELLKQDALLYELKFWRTRFILIPAENSSIGLVSGATSPDEEARIDGIIKFLDSFERAANMRTDNRGDITSFLRCTTLDLSIYLKNPDEAKPSKPMGNPVLTKNSSPAEIVAAMLDPESDLIRENRWRLGSYQNSMKGSEFVLWLQRNFSDIRTRQEAIDFGVSLQSREVIEHCEKKHKFMDGYYIYQICQKYAARRKSGFFLTKVLKGTPAAPKKSADTIGTVDNMGTGNEPPPVIELSKAILIDVDPSKKSDRKEAATLHYDTIYNPDNGYHFELNWLQCTSRLIEEMLIQWGNMARKHGLKLVEAPIEQAMSLSDNNPFQSPTFIKLSVPPPPLVREKLHPHVDPHLYFEKQLVKEFKFILDVEADDRFPEVVQYKYSYYKTAYQYSQYIHRSGVAFIQIRDPGEGFLWVNNRLFTTQNSNRGHPNPDHLMNEFQRFCENETELGKFWENVKNNVPWVEEAEVIDGVDGHDGNDGRADDSTANDDNVNSYEINGGNVIDEKVDEKVNGGNVNGHKINNANFSCDKVDDGKTNDEEVNDGIIDDIKVDDCN